MADFSWQAYVALAVLAAILGVLTLTRLAVDVVMLAGLTLLLVTGVLSVPQALSGLASEGMVTVGVLYVVVAGLRDTGAMSWVAARLFGRPSSTTNAQLRVMLPVAPLSAFMNNTPLVAALLPAVNEWAKKHGISLSKLLMPLSFATILGGLCTLIGTSTNVIVAGLMKEAYRSGEVDTTMGFFTLGAVGLPCAVVGMAYMLVAHRWLLPERTPAIHETDDPRNYTVEMLVADHGPVAGKTIEQAGLRNLSAMYLAEVERDGDVIPAVSPSFRLQAGDRLVFVGLVDSVLELQRMRGLVPAMSQVFKLDGPRAGRTLVEAVVSDRNPHIGKTIRDARFRTQYNAVVVAVARSGERLKQKIGDIELQSGDTLLLEARPAFVQQQRNAGDFFLVSAIEGSEPPRHEKATTALAILVGMVVLATVFEQSPWFIERGFGMLHAALIAAGLMLVTGCCSAESGRRNVDWQVLIVIAAAVGIGKALETSGAAQAIASTLIAGVGRDPLLQLAAIYLMTMLLTEAVTNNSAAVLMFPIGIATADALGVHYMPFVVALTIAASCGFATPIGYQTNMMIYGPGGYRFGDFLRFGGVLDLIVCAVTLVVTPLMFPFAGGN